MRTFIVEATNYDNARTVAQTYTVQVPAGQSEAATIEQAYREAHRQACAVSEDTARNFRAMEWLYRVTCREVTGMAKTGSPTVTHPARHADRTLSSRRTAIVQETAKALSAA